MPQTFEDAVRQAALRLPNLPYLLVRDFVQDVYTAAMERRAWGHLRTQTSVVTLPARTQVVTVTLGSPTVTGTFTGADVGRQLRLGSYPFYTITAQTGVSATLDRPYAGLTETGEAQILTAYVSMPADFHFFLTIVDPSNQRPIAFGLSQESLGFSDPMRTQSGDPVRAFVSAGITVAGLFQYELHPLPTAARSYPVYYVRAAERFTETSFLPGVWSNRADVLKIGALAFASEWPGTRDQKNPHYSLELHDRLKREYEYELQRLQLADDNVYPDDLMLPYGAGACASGGADLARQTDATLADYY